MNKTTLEAVLRTHLRMSSANHPYTCACDPYTSNSIDDHSIHLVNVISEQESQINNDLEDALMYARCQIGHFKVAQSAIANLDRENIDVLAVGRILSKLRDDVGVMFTDAVLGLKDN